MLLPGSIVGARNKARAEAAQDERLRRQIFIPRAYNTVSHASY